MPPSERWAVERCSLGAVTPLTLPGAPQHLGEQQGQSAKAGRLI